MSCLYFKAAWRLPGTLEASSGQEKKPDPGSLISATHRRGVHFSQDFLLSAFSFPPFFFLVHILWFPWDGGSGIWNSVKVLIRGESQDHKQFGLQTVRKLALNDSAHKAENFSFPAGRMELTVILRLLKEPCPGVISVLSDNVDI